MTSRDHILAEIQSVRQIIDSIPEDQVIDRESFQGRVDQLEEQLADLACYVAPPKIDLYFDGAPVLGSYGIGADFAADQLKMFSNAVMACDRDLRGQLKTQGPLGRSELFVTRRLAGSFGFELQAVRPGLDDVRAEDLRSAIESVGAVIDGSLKGDAELADAAEDIQPRVLGYVRRFFENCVSQSATFRIVAPGKDETIAGEPEIKVAAQRLLDTKTERLVEKIGHFIGTFTDQPRFEFQEADGDREVFKGKFDTGIERDRLRQLLASNLLNQKFKAQFRVTRVGASARAVRYLLIDFEPVS